MVKKPDSAKVTREKEILETEVTPALVWLAKHQLSDGHWSLQHYGDLCKDKSCTGPGDVSADVGATAMGLLPFLAAGQTHISRGKYKEHIAKGIDWLIKNQQPDGNLAKDAAQTMNSHLRPAPIWVTNMKGVTLGLPMMYSHGLATIALCEAYGLSGDRRVGMAAQGGVNFILNAQNTADGGWRDNPKDAADTSVVGWQVMALKSAHMAGLNVGGSVFSGASKWLDSVAVHDGTEYAYQPGNGSSNTMTAVGLLCRQYLGAKRDNPMLVGGMAYLLNHLPDEDFSNIYYWYYATQVMHNMSGYEWDTWNRKMRDLLVHTQVCNVDQCANGSWAPEKDAWGKHGGRIMTTSLSCLTLEIYYRYLPLFKPEAGGQNFVLRACQPQTVEIGRTFNVTMTVENAGIWRGKLRYSLGPDAPVGSTIGAETGVFTWTPAESQKPGKYDVTVFVAAPDGRETQAAFAVTVIRPFLVDIGQGVKLEMVLIPAGQFLMGSPDSAKDAGGDEKPQHRVRITRPFYLCKYPVTQEQWVAVMGSNPSHHEGPKNPVECVTWDDSQQFVGRLNERFGRLHHGHVLAVEGEFRLPTEAQWEYACRAGSTTRFCYGNDVSALGDYAWYAANSGGKTHPVGEKKSNAWGLYDMHGNVWEWCQDWYDGTYYVNSPTDDPPGPATGSNRAIRGGCYADGTDYCLSAKRRDFTFKSTVLYFFMGLRVALVSAAKPVSLDGLKAAVDLPSLSKGANDVVSLGKLDLDPKEVLEIKLLGGNTVAKGNPKFELQKDGDGATPGWSVQMARKDKDPVKIARVCREGSEWKIQWAVEVKDKATLDKATLLRYCGLQFSCEKKTHFIALTKPKTVMPLLIHGGRTTLSREFPLPDPSVLRLQILPLDKSMPKHEIKILEAKDLARATRAKPAEPVPGNKVPVRGQVIVVFTEEKSLHVVSVGFDARGRYVQLQAGLEWLSRDGTDVAVHLIRENESIPFRVYADLSEKDDEASPKVVIFQSGGEIERPGIERPNKKAAKGNKSKGRVTPDSEELDLK